MSGGMYQLAVLILVLSLNSSPKVLWDLVYRPQNCSVAKVMHGDFHWLMYNY